MEVDPGGGLQFFRCGACRRDYALRSPGQLVDRWRSPLSLVLYPIIYSTDPRADAGKVVKMFAGHLGVSEIVSDIRAELSKPTQRVRDIHRLEAPETVVSEADVREFLRLVAEGLASTRS